jgi:hypothetical protein
MRYLHTEKGLRGLKLKIYFAFGLLTVIVFPLIVSFAKRYRHDKGEQELAKNIVREMEGEVEKLGVRMRLKY